MWIYEELRNLWTPLVQNSICGNITAWLMHFHFTAFQPSTLKTITVKASGCFVQNWEIFRLPCVEAIYCYSVATKLLWLHLGWSHDNMILVFHQIMHDWRTVSWLQGGFSISPSFCLLCDVKCSRATFTKKIAVTWVTLLFKSQPRGCLSWQGFVVFLTSSMKVQG
jgi:hypothetical protein